MPLIHVTLIAGYSDDLKLRLTQALSRAARAVIPAKPEATIIAVNDVPPSGYLRGTEPPQPAAEPEAPETVVQRFLTALADRDLPTAEACLAPDVSMVFPGNRRFGKLEELVTWSKDRYRWVKKRIDHLETTGGDEGPVVTCFGTLYGEWPDGTAFNDVRFIDRFTLRDGLIADQFVWNDLAEAILDKEGAKA